LLAIRPCTAEELFSEPMFGSLVAEYAQESSITGLPPVNPQRELYQMLDRSGCVTAFAAHVGDDLVGFIVALTSINPHYGVKITAIESYFVGAKHRSTGAGMRLLREVEKAAKTNGATAVLVSAPSGGRLAEIMPRVGYHETNRIFFWGLDD
jgi:GNAT superfamily N-acetyltransferase